MNKNTIDSLLSRNEAEEIRRLVMTGLRPLARTDRRLSDSTKRGLGFTCYINSGGVIGSDEKDYFVSVLSTSYINGDWSLVVSILENILSEENRYSNHRQLYKFEGDMSEECFARKKIYINIGRILNTRIMDDGTIVDTVLPERYESLEPIGPEECDILADSLLTHMKDLRQLNTKK